MSEGNGNGGAPHRRNRHRRRRHRPPGNALTLKHAAQIVQIEEIAKTKREAQAITLRLAGRSYREIAEKMEIGYDDAVDAVQRVLKRDWEVDAEKVNELRQLEINRLDRLWNVYFPRALGNEEEGVQPNMAAAGYCLKIAKRRAELLGLDREAKTTAPVNFNFGADAIRQMSEAAQDPATLEAMEKVAALFAHGDDATVEAEWEEEAPLEEPPLGG